MKTLVYIFGYPVLGLFFAYVLGLLPTPVLQAISAIGLFVGYYWVSAAFFLGVVVLCVFILRAIWNAI